MSKKVVLVIAMLYFTSRAFAQQTCYESQPPQLNLSCEDISGNIKLRFEILDITQSTITDV